MMTQGPEEFNGMKFMDSLLESLLLPGGKSRMISSQQWRID